MFKLPSVFVSGRIKATSKATPANNAELRRRSIVPIHPRTGGKSTFSRPWVGWCCLYSLSLAISQVENDLFHGTLSSLLPLQTMHQILWLGAVDQLWSITVIHSYDLRLRKHALKTALLIGRFLPADRPPQPKLIGRWMSANEASQISYTKKRSAGATKPQSTFTNSLWGFVFFYNFFPYRFGGSSLKLCTDAEQWLWSWYTPIRGKANLIKQNAITPHCSKNLLGFLS